MRDSNFLRKRNPHNHSLTHTQKQTETDTNSLATIIAIFTVKSSHTHPPAFLLTRASVSLSLSFPRLHVRHMPSMASSLLPLLPSSSSSPHSHMPGRDILIIVSSSSLFLAHKKTHQQTQFYDESRDALVSLSRSQPLSLSPPSQRLLSFLFFHAPVALLIHTRRETPFHDRHECMSEGGGCLSSAAVAARALAVLACEGGRRES